MYTRNNSGGMVPLGSLMDVQRISGPDTVGHYNVYPAALIQGTTLPGVSSGQAIEKMERICRENLPSQFSFEWTQLTYQEVTAGNTAIFIFPLCVLFVFLALAAQYENWSLPLAVILIVPMCLLSAWLGFIFEDRTTISSRKSNSLCSWRSPFRGCHFGGFGDHSFARP